MNSGKRANPLGAIQHFCPCGSPAHRKFDGSWACESCIAKDQTAHLWGDAWAEADHRESARRLMDFRLSEAESPLKAVFA